MNFTTNSFSTVVQCDEQLVLVNREKSNLEARITIMEIQRTGYTENSAEMQQDLADMNAALTDKINKINAAPDGEDKDKLIGEKMFLEARIFKLTTRIANQASANLLDKEYDILKAQMLIQAATEYITALEARKVELAA